MLAQDVKNTIARINGDMDDVSVAQYGQIWEVTTTDHLGGPSYTEIWIVHEDDRITVIFDCDLAMLGDPFDGYKFEAVGPMTLDEYVACATI